jgi:hypothetical protein
MYYYHLIHTHKYGTDLWVLQSDVKTDGKKVTQKQLENIAQGIGIEYDKDLAESLSLERINIYSVTFK